LYVTGDPDVLSLPGVAIVGTRTPSLYGIEMAQSFAAGMAGKGMSVISGLATGIDAAAHKGALLAGGITIGVLGGALDKFFPDENRELARKIIAANGAVISEYPFGFPPGKFTFPQRNRIVAALSRGVLAAECPLRSGTLITCSIAKDIGRKVMAIPANINSRTSAGCWNLIKSGSLMVTGIKDVVDAVGAISASAQGARHASFAPKAEKAVIAESQRKASPMKKPNAARKTKCALTLEESSILKAVPSAGITLDRLAFSTKLPAGTVAKATMSLRIKRLLRFLPGNRVAPLVDGV
jgi:DNA processing protein